MHSKTATCFAIRGEAQQGQGLDQGLLSAGDDGFTVPGAGSLQQQQQQKQEVSADGVHGGGDGNTQVSVCKHSPSHHFTRDDLRDQSSSGKSAIRGFSERLRFGRAEIARGVRRVERLADNAYR